MPHTPPVPAGNQSPYPLHEAPHKKAPSAPPPGDARVARTPDRPAAPVPTLFAVAAGVGLAAIAGGLFLAVGGTAKSKPKGKKKRARPQG